MSQDPHRRLASAALSLVCAAAVVAIESTSFRPQQTPGPAGGVPAGIVEPGDAKSAGDPRGRKRPHREPRLHALVLVRFGLAEALAVEHAGVHFAMTSGQRREVAGAEIRRSWNQAFPFGEHLPLHTIAIDALFEIEPRRLMGAQPDPAARCDVVELGERILHPHDQAPGERSVVDAPDVRCQPEAHVLRDLCVDIEIGPGDVEAVEAVAVLQLGVVLEIRQYADADDGIARFGRRRSCRGRSRSRCGLGRPARHQPGPYRDRGQRVPIHMRLLVRRPLFGEVSARLRLRYTGSALTIPEVMADVLRRHHENHVLGDVGRMIADSFEMT